MATSVAGGPPSCLPRLLEALLKGTNQLMLRSILANASPLELSAGDSEGLPMSLYHAAAAAGNAAAISLLVAAGCPVAAGEKPFAASGEALHLTPLIVPSLSPDQRDALLLTPAMSALRMAAELGHAEVAAVLLGAGADPRLGLQVGQQKLSRLLCRTAGRCAALARQGVDVPAVLQQLLAAGADAAACSMEALCSCAQAHRGAGLLLLDLLQQRCAAGTFRAPHPWELVCLFRAEGYADSVECLDVVARRLRLPAFLSNAAREYLIRSAAEQGSMQVMALVLQACAPAASGARQTTSAGRWLGGSHASDRARLLLEASAQHGHTGVLQQQLQAGRPATMRALRAAMLEGRTEAMQALVSHGLPKCNHRRTSRRSPLSLLCPNPQVGTCYSLRFAIWSALKIRVAKASGCSDHLHLDAACSACNIAGLHQAWADMSPSQLAPVSCFDCLQNDHAAWPAEAAAQEHAAAGLGAATVRACLAAAAAAAPATPLLA